MINDRGWVVANKVSAPGDKRIITAEAARAFVSWGLNNLAELKNRSSEEAADDVAKLELSDHQPRSAVPRRPNKVCRIRGASVSLTRGSSDADLLVSLPSRTPATGAGAVGAFWL